MLSIFFMTKTQTYTRLPVFNAKPGFSIIIIVLQCKLNFIHEAYEKGQETIRNSRQDERQQKIQRYKKFISNEVYNNPNILH